MTVQNSVLKLKICLELEKGALSIADNSNLLLFVETILLRDQQVLVQQYQTAVWHEQRGSSLGHIALVFVA